MSRTIDVMRTESANGATSAKIINKTTVSSIYILKRVPF